MKTEHVLITAHKGSDMYDKCHRCQQHVDLKGGRPAFYWATETGLLWVCWECARELDPATVELLDADWQSRRLPL